MKRLTLFILLVTASLACAQPKSMTAELYKRNGIWYAMDPQAGFKKYRLTQFPKSYKGYQLTKKFYYATITGEEIAGTYQKGQYRQPNP